MRRILFATLLGWLPVAFILAQKDIKVFEKVEINANTNEKAWAEHITRNTQLPDSALKNIPPGSYRVSVQFIVDVHGSIGQVKAKNDPGFGLVWRALNIISSYPGVWKPASQCGRNVKSYKEQPVVFIVRAQ